MATSQSTPKTVGFEGANPILRVRDIDASVDYYVDKLGFHLNWKYPYFADVARDRVSIFLSKGDQGHFGGWIWIGVQDCAALWKEYKRSGAKIRHPPTNYAWAYEMQVEDLDGNVLRMGSEPKESEPYGKWLDMEGKVWPPEPKMKL
jgi:catechol 2,3-dioxygenase-like lactoylglutathione lyase family enzyme